MAETISSERSGRVLEIRIANPPHNFMNRVMVGELYELIDGLEEDDSIGAVVIRGGVEGSFLTHYDVEEIVDGVEDVGVTTGPATAGALLRGAGGLSRLPGGRGALSRTPARGLVELRRIHELFGKMNRLDKVFVAAINGVATGGGCELALACDIRYIGEGAGPIGLPEMTLGFNPGAGGTQRLTRLLGAGRALEMMLEGRTLEPARALEIGLVHRVVADSELLGAARETAERMARRSPESVAALKRAVYEGGAMDLDEGLAVERKWFMACGGTEASRRAMRDFVAQVERDGASPWRSAETIRPWQEGTASELTPREEEERADSEAG